MSRQLPEKPNLEFLKKQAKELLRSRQQGKLADAQLAVARYYNFRDWAALEEHVAAVTRKDSVVYRFEAAVEAVVEGDLPVLQQKLRAQPGLSDAEIVSNISNTILRPTAYSQVK